MTQIKVDVTEFMTVAKKFDAAAEHCTKIQEQLKSASEDLLNHWLGKSRDAFNNEYKILYKNMYNYKDVLQCISKDLTAIASQFNDVDTALKTGMSKTDTDK